MEREVKILFVAKYCPAHFQNLLLYLSLNNQHQIQFFSEYRHNELTLKNISYTNLRFPKVQYKGSKAEQASVRFLRRALVFSNAFTRLKDSGFIPDVIFVDTNHACALNVTNVFENVPCIGFCDWYINDFSSDYEITPNEENDNSQVLALKLSNMFQLEVLNSCTKLLTFSQWQKKAFPDFLQKKISVIYEGVNTDFFTPIQEKKAKVEFLKGFEEEDIIIFSPRVFKNSDKTKVVINAMLSVLNKHEKVKFLLLSRGKSSSDEFSEVFAEVEKTLAPFSDRLIIHRNATLEEYKYALAYSKINLMLFDLLFVNTSLFEAMASANIIIAQKNKALEEFIHHEENGFFHDYEDADSLAELVLKLLDDKEKQRAIQVQARKYAVANLSIRNELKKTLKHLSSLQKTQ